MKRLVPILVLPCLLLAFSAAYAAQDDEQGRFTIESSKTKATIEALDFAAMTAKLKLENGKQVEVKLDPKVKHLDRIHVGDDLDVKKTLTLLLYLKRDKEDPQSYKLRDVQYEMQSNGKPVKYIVETQVSSAVVKDFDKKGSFITLEGADGKEVKYKITKPVKGFSNVRKGDRIYARYTESVTVLVKPKKDAK